MLRIYDVSLDVVEELQPIIRQIERFDRDLARQLKKASTSVPSNVAEGSARASPLTRRQAANRPQSEG